MKKVAITGVSGYIGTLLLRRLDELEDIEGIVGIDREPPRCASPKLTFYRQDVRQPFADIFVHNDVDSAIHLAFVVPPAGDRDAHSIDIDGTRNFLDACAQGPVRSLLYVSSNTAYGARPDNPLPITEEQPLRPVRGFPYGWDKAEADRMFQDFMEQRPDLSVTIVRAPPVVGPEAGACGFSVLLKPVMVRVIGFDPPWQFVHEEDLVELVVALFGREQGGVFNAGADGPVRYSGVIAEARRPSVPLPSAMLSFLIDISWRLGLQRSSPVGGLEFLKHPMVLSSDKVKRTAGFEFRYSSRDALLSFLDAARRTA